MKCANCDSPALYVYDPKPLRPTAYCAAHLPAFLRQSAKAGTLPVTEAYEQTKREAIAALAPAAPATEAPQEAVEAPAPKKRRRTAKKAAPTPVEEPIPVPEETAAEASIEEPLEEA